MEAVAVVGLKAGLPERQMSGCRAWPRSSESLDSWPVWFWAWSALDWQCPSSPCSCSTPESSPSCSLWAAPSPCPASPFCGVLTITWSTCSAGSGFLSQGDFLNMANFIETSASNKTFQTASTSLPSSSPSTLPWASSLPFSLQLQLVPR